MDREILKKKRRKLKRTVFFTNLLIYIIFCMIFDKLVNFPEHFKDILFQIKVIKLPLICYFIGIAIISYIIEIIIFNSLTFNVNRYISKKEIELDKDELKKIRNECMSISYKYMIYNVVAMLVVDFLAFFCVYGIARFFMTNFEKVKIFYLRIGMLISAIWLLSSVFSYNFVQKYANEIINLTYENNRYYYKNKITVTNTFNITMQIIPILVTVLIFFINFSYTNMIDTYSKNIAGYYDVYMSTVSVDSYEIDSRELLEYLENNIAVWDESNIFFVIDYDGSVVSKMSKEISSFMLEYMNSYFYYYTDENGKQGIDLTQDNNIIYDSYGIDEHAYVRMIKDKYGRKVYIGVKYFAGNTETFSYLIGSGIAILIAYIAIIIYWAKANSANMKRLEKYMNAILSDRDILKKNFMPIISADELGNISYYYNKIQEKLLTQRDIMFKQEQLSVLGELAGGMAHDINTPISSINTSILMLDKNAKTEQEKEILENMQISTDRIINIVNSMRNQIRNLGSNDKEKFSLNQMVADLHVITQNEQKKNGCTFESDVKEEIEIYGERTKLGQVLTNIVVNSIQAYGGNGKKGNVKLTAFKKDINTCRIEIADQAGGIPEKVQKYLFKNIMTTKGAKGTGLGLYLAGSVIKGIYQGNIWFEVEKNVGTTFIIEIPMNMEG
jgi:signal transduction histidine kinase